MAIVRTILPRKGIIQPKHGDNYETDLDTNWTLVDSLLQDSADVQAAVFAAGTVEAWLTDRGLCGVISGLGLGTSATLTPALAVGVLYAQGKRYAPTSAPNPGPAPASSSSYLFYNSASRLLLQPHRGPRRRRGCFAGQRRHRFNPRDCGDQRHETVWPGRCSSRRGGQFCPGASAGARPRWRVHSDDVLRRDLVPIVGHVRHDQPLSGGFRRGSHGEGASMVTEKDSGSRIQDSGRKGLGTAGWGLVVLLVTCHLSLVTALGQQPQAQAGQPVFAANAKYVQGVGPGYWPTAATGLALNLAAGTAYCGNPPALVTYAGGTLTLAPSATNYVYLDPVTNCAPAASTSGFLPGHIPLAKVVTGASTITSVTDARTWFAPQPITTDATGGALVSLKKLNGIRFADQFPGANATAKLDAAIADIGSGPGVVVAMPTIGAGSPSSFRNDVAILDLRQTYDVIGGWESDPDRAPLVLLENHLGELTTKTVTGTVTLTNGSTAVTGVGTQFLTQFPAERLGRSIKLNADASNAWAAVLSVTDDTHMTLKIPYPGTGGTGPASYFITHPGLVIDTLAEGGDPNTGAGGEGVGLTAIGWRTGGTRGIWSGNFNTGYYTRDPKAAAVGLEVDLSNFSSADAVPTSSVEEALRIVTAGPKRPGTGIHLVKAAGSGEFVRGLWIDNSYSSQGVFVKGPSNHLYLVPTADNNSPMLVGRNAADSATPWQINNDGTASFSGAVITPGADAIHFRSGPDVSSFTSPTLQSLMNDSLNVFGGLNSARTNALIAANESTGTDFQVGVYGAAVSKHPSGSKVITLGVEGDSYHQSAGTVDWLIGVGGYADMSGASGTVGSMIALYAYPNSKSAGTVTNNYGLYVDEQTVGTNNYSIYTAGTAPAQFGGPVISGLKVVTFSATPTFDAKLGNTQKITLTGNVTSSTLSNATAGEQLNFLICQDSAGNHTFVWPSNVKGGMTIGSTASKCSAQTFIFDGTNAYALSPGVSNM